MPNRAKAWKPGLSFFIDEFIDEFTDEFGGDNALLARISHQLSCFYPSTTGLVFKPIKRQSSGR
jgi:hypothetical protein